MSEQKMRDALNQVLSASLKYKLEESDMCVELAREALAQPTEAVKLTYNEIARVCVDVYGLTADIGWYMEFARAVIAAHEAKRSQQ